MSGGRISVAGLIVAVSASALAIASLIRPTSAWAASSFLALLVSLLTSVVGAIFRRGGARAFWVGFAVFGWGWMLLGIVPNPASSARSEVFDTLSQASHALYPPDVAGLPGDVGVMDDAQKARYYEAQMTANQRAFHFVAAANPLLAMGFGVLGGLIGSYFHSRSEAERRREVTQ